MGNQDITFKGSKLGVSGTELRPGDTVPTFTLTNTDMSDFTNEHVHGKVVIYLAVPSLDTPVCSMETKRFNTEATSLSKDVAVVVVSRDLPFAQKRWCGAEGVENVTTVSDYKYQNFGKSFGVYIDDWGLLARAAFVADQSGTITYVEYVPEISSEPKYDSVLDAVRSLLR